jgi:hypothetical protein
MRTRQNGSGMTTRMLSSAVVVGGLLVMGVRTQAQTYSTFTGDADSGISATKTYTAAVAFEAPGPLTINGVTFSTGLSGPTWNFNDGAVNANLVALNSISNTAVGVMGSLLSNGVYNVGGGADFLFLTGLTPGQTYRTTFYSVGWQNGLNAQDVTVYVANPNPWNPIFTYTQSLSGEGNPNMLTYDYVAASSQIEYVIVPGTIGFIGYGVSNELVVVPEPSSLALLGLGLGLLGFGYRWRKQRVH